MVMEMAYLEASNRRLTADNELMASKYERELSEHKATTDRQAREIESRTAEAAHYRQANEELASKVGTQSSIAARFQKLYETLKRNATLDEIQHTASQLGGHVIEAGTGGGTTLVDQQQPALHRPMYSTGTSVSPRYTNAHPTGQHPLVLFQDSRLSGTPPKEEIHPKVRISGCD
ncbi:hypothetical protein NKR19_g6907 [Coniochaeta hoffmannii]|uniref:Uncharacterized protein n=1 Tax=Coniochaeta hoffmannii TaxID=91930 RepID=A0AA38VE12_9PEZI|nr:hypothetical protein NKR19_g6907 [Coniochaeta hoffmannii]